MRTFITFVSLIATLALSAQTEYGSVVLPDPSISEEVLTRCARTWDNIKPWMSADTVTKWCPNYVARYGLEGACIKILKRLTIEGDGEFSTPGRGYGPAHVQQADVYDDYFRRHPDAERFPISDLDSTKNLHLTLMLMDEHLTAPYGYDTEEKAERGWNGGPDGKGERERAPGESDESWQAHLQRIANTRVYWDDGNEFERGHAELIRLGIAHGL